MNAPFVNKRNQNYLAFLVLGTLEVIAIVLPALSKHTNIIQWWTGVACLTIVFSFQVWRMKPKLRWQISWIAATYLFLAAFALNAYPTIHT